MRKLKSLILLCFVMGVLTSPRLISQSVKEINVDSFFLKFINFEESENVRPLEELKEFRTFTSLLENKYNPDKPLKSLNKLFKQVHDKYFTQYNENPVFSEIFRNGSYNCVTASALYGFIFELLKIPYEIREVPTHVYVVAYPRKYNITVESTVPSKGVIELRNKEIEEYKKELVANKILSEEEINNPDFLQEYIFQDSTINIENLFGIQIYNRGVGLMEKEKYEESIHLLNRAKKYHNRDYIDQLILANIGLMMQNMESLSVEEKCYLLGEYYNIVKEEVEDPTSSTMGMFYVLTEENTVSEKIANNLLELSDCLAQNSFVSSELKDAVSNSTGIVNALYYYNALDTDKALFYLVETFDKDNKNSYRLISEILGNHLQKISSPSNGIDSLSKYEQIFPFIKSDPILQSFGVWCHMRIVYLKFELGEEKEGLQMLEKFENRYNIDDDLKYDPQPIGFGYGAASSYYVRQKDEEKAEGLLKRGLEYSSESLELNKKLRLIQSDSW